MIQKPAETQVEIEKVIAERWSGRAYDPTIAVTDEQITALCEAARWAPSCFGEAPWRFMIWNRFNDEASWQKAYDCLVEGNQAWAKDAPVLLLAASEENFTQNDKPNKWNGYDTGAASLNLCLQATAMGLMSHQMGGFDGKKVRETFELPKTVNLWSMIAIGHAAPLDDLNTEQMEQELTPRERRPLAEQFFYNSWKKS